MTSAQYAKSINTLSRATLISTNQSTDSKENMRKCVNALSRAITISTFCNCYTHCEFEWCQCPKPSNNHFYSWEVEWNYRGSLCQCPKTSNNHFYRHKLYFISKFIWCVNVLSRAITISTTESKKKNVRIQERVNALSRAITLSTNTNTSNIWYIFVSMP